jgi:hypothetical protein
MEVGSMAPAKKKKTAVKKKTAKKKIVPKLKAKTVDLGIRSVKFHCQGGTCTADPPSRHLLAGDLVVLFATNTGVTITFMSGSPFLSGTTSITLAQGQFSLEIVADGIPSGTTFPYTLVCTKPLCATLSGPPDMIVD